MGGMVGDIDHCWRHGCEDHRFQVLLFLLDFRWLWCDGSGWSATLDKENDYDDDEDGGE